MWNAATPDALTVPPGNARIDFPIVLLSFALFLSFFTTAWVAEDAYITFRVVDNALNGHGLVWNPGERVQVYTHPLWFFLLLAGSSLYDNPYVACLVISALCVVATFWLALKTLRPCGVLSFLVLFLLFFSRAFVDYMTSGLENPLVYLFVALFLWVYLEREKHRHCLFFLTLIAAAMYLSRPDSIVLIFPALLHVFLADEKPWPRKIALLLLGGLPALAWVLFSLVYYGAPVPNTALAKVMTGISTAEYLAQAVQYTLHTLQTDTVTVVLLLAGCLVGFWQSSWRLKALSLGIFLWFAYLAAVGADYMAGRFFSIPVLFAVLTLARALRDRPFGKPGVVLLVALALALPQARFTLFSPVAYNSREISPFGVADERGYYYPGTGLRPALKRSGEVTAQHFWVSLGGALKDAMIPGGGVYVACQIGMLPYTAGADFHWVDALALTDAFLARLPARSGNRVGHYERALPPGYLESVLTKQNRVVDPALARLYDDVALATTGDIFRWERLAAIFRLNTGFHRNAAANFDREAVGLPGLPVLRKDMFSCLGNEGGQAWHVDESLRVVHIRELLRARLRPTDRQS